MEKNKTLNYKEVSARYIEGINLSNKPVATYGSSKRPVDSLTYNDGDYHCLIPRVYAVSLGSTFSVTDEECACMGGRVYLGYSSSTIEGFEYFLSTGHPEVMGGRCERFKESPEIVLEMMKESDDIKPLGKYTVFQPLDEVPENIKPDILTFFVPPDKLSALVFLVGFPTADRYVIKTPFASGCGSILVEPMKLPADKPGAILGGFDIAARPYIPKEILTLSLRYDYAVKLAIKMPETFLNIEPWVKYKKR
jgi:hypothetical protein